MVENVLQEYLEALADLDKVKGEADAMVRSVTDASRLLSDGQWKREMFSNSSGGGFPVGMMHSPSIDVKRVASMQDIATKASQYHTALSKAEDLWRRLSDTQKRGVKAVER